MGQFSGVCDLQDHIAMQKMYDKGHYSVSDELECFNIFKKKTGGVIHQHRQITVSEWNQDFVKGKCDNFDFREVITEVVDKRVKEGKRIVKSYIYSYFGKEYSNLKELNKKGVYITEDIHFETLLDIIPYYPHVVSISYSEEGREYVVISSEPAYMKDYRLSLRDGGRMSYPEQYIQELSRHYFDVVHTYYEYKLEERTKQISLIDAKPLHNGYYELLLPKPADRVHEVRFVWADGKSKTHWTTPKLSECEDNVVLIHQEDIERYLENDIRNNTVMLEYVEACEMPNEARDS